MARAIRGRTLSIGSIGAGVTLLAFSAFTPSVGATDNPTPYSGNTSCTDLGDAGFKIDAQPVAGTYTTSSGNVEISGDLPDDLTIHISSVVHDDTAQTVTFNWSASVSDGDDADDEPDGYFIDKVLVKYANGGLQWTYPPPGASADTAWANNDTISHVSFCASTDDRGGTTDGSTDGTTDGSSDGTTDGSSDGTTDGTTDGSTDGTTDGSTDGTTDGSTDGTTDGSTDGTTDGSTDGTTDGSTDGTTDGSTDDVLGTSTGGTDDSQVLGASIVRETGSSGTQADSLPRTGRDDMSLVVAASALIAAGTGALFLRNRRPRGQHFTH